MPEKDCYPCVLLMNDMHVSKDNIAEFNTNWKEALSICSQMGIGEIALGGDLFQSRSSQTLNVLLAVHDALLAAADHGINIYLANGNHDLICQESIRGYCHVFDQHDNVMVVDDYLTLPTNNERAYALHMIAYFPENGSFTEILNQLIADGLDDKRRNYLYIHEGINGALSQPAENELPANIFGDFDRVFVGHYHNRCTVGNHIEYIGSSRQHNFGEDEQKGYTILYSDGSTKFIQNKANIRYKVIDVAQVDVNLTDLLDEIKADGRYRTKVRVHTTSAKASTIYKEKLLSAGASKIEIITEDTEMTDVASSSLFEKFDSRKIQENYKEFCREKEIGNVELGLNYLSKIEASCGN